MQVFHELIFQENFKMSTERAEKPDLGHFKVNWLRHLKREECPCVSEFSTKDRGRVRVEEMMNGCSEPSSLKREGLQHITSSNRRQPLLLSTDSTSQTWHSTWTSSIQPSVLPLSGPHCTFDPLVLFWPLLFLHPFYRKPNRYQNIEKSLIHKLYSMTAWCHFSTILLLSPNQYYHHICVQCDSTTVI